MYVRFVTPERGGRGAHLGPFRAAYAFAEDDCVCAALREALSIEIAWFRAELPVPPWRAFKVKSRGGWRDDGLCWFVDDAREMIAHAFVLAALLRDCGLPVVKLATRSPGQILYRDAWQIVAKPAAATPVAWE